MPDRHLDPGPVKVGAFHSERETYLAWHEHSEIFAHAVLCHQLQQPETGVGLSQPFSVSERR